MNLQIPLSSEQTLLLILVPMLVVVIGMRLYLHLVRVTHVYIGGHVFRHLFQGVILVIPAGFILAFAPQQPWLMVLALAVFGASSGLILDEIVYLMATKTTDEDYVSGLSLRGSIWFNIIGAIVLFTIYMLLT